MNRFPLTLVVIVAVIGLASGYFYFTDLPKQEASMELQKVEGMPANLDLSKTQISYWKKYTVSYTSSLNPLSINSIHRWEIQVKTIEGVPVENAKIAFVGGMPMHQHGLPTAPRITKNMGQGKYLIEGMKFNMTGWWELKFEIDTGSEQDIVTFNVILR